jgi:hypothetical protein
MARDESHAAADQYGANLLPFLVMIDRTGRVAYVHTGYSEKQLDGFVDEINGLLDESAASEATRAAGG